MSYTPSEFEQKVIDLYLTGIKPYSMTRMPDFKGYYPSSLDRIIEKYGYKMRVPKRPPDSFEQGIIVMYENGASVPQIIKMEQYEGITASRVYSILNKFRVRLRSNKINSRRYKINHIFFSTIDSEAKAYWLGFIYADGYVTTKGSYIGLSLARKDKSHLEKFVGALQANYQIKEYKVSNGYGKGKFFCRVLICSEIMKADLINKGVLTNKSLKLVFPSPQIIPTDLIHHFIRGYHDRDGSLSHYRRDDLKCFSIKICGTYDFLSTLKNLLKDYLELEGLGSISKRKKDNKNNYYLTIGGNLQVAKVLNFLYRDATLYLDRKYLRYLDFKNCQTKSSQQQK